MHSGQHDDREEPATGPTDGTDGAEEQIESTGRPRRSAYRNGDGQKPRGQQHIESYNSVDEMEEESDATSSGGEWEGGDDDDVDDNIADEEDDADVEMSEDDASNVEEDVGGEENGRRRSLVVSLRYQKNKNAHINSSIQDEGGPTQDISAPNPGPPPRYDTPESKPYSAVQTGSPAPLITNIHAAVVAEPSTESSAQAGPIPNGHMVDQQKSTMSTQDGVSTSS